MKHYLRRDWFISVILVLIMVLFAGMHLTHGSNSWGDDFAAYLSEGISISQNNFDEQIKTNYFLHPTSLPVEADSDELVYVWGYPLFLSIVHRLVGYDTINFTSVIYYKLPSLIAFAMTIGVLYLLYRRFFGCGISLLLVLFFAVSGDFIYLLNTMYSDIMFLFFSILTLWLNECFLNAVVDGKKTGVQLLLTFLLALAMWLCYETRLNGLTIIALTATASGIMLLKNRTQIKQRDLLFCLLPYVFFFLMRWISETVLAPATPNLSDIADTSLPNILKNLKHYGKMICNYLGRGDDQVGFWVGLFFAVFFFAGFITEGIKCKFVPFSLLIAGTYALVIVLPYQQGLRYIYNILPFIILYVTFGVRFAFRLIRSNDEVKNALKIAAGTLAVLFLVFTYSTKFSAGIQNIKNGRQPDAKDPYSSYATETYRYIQNNVSEEETIIFFKPRALYLNTGRLSIVTDINGHRFEEADYFLYYEYGTGMQSRIMKNHSDSLEPVFSNKKFILYKISK